MLVLRVSDLMHVSIRLLLCLLLYISWLLLPLMVITDNGLRWLESGFQGQCGDRSCDFFHFGYWRS